MEKRTSGSIYTMGQKQKPLSLGGILQDQILEYLYMYKAEVYFYGHLHLVGWGKAAIFQDGCPQNIRLRKNGKPYLDDRGLCISTYTGMVV